MTPSPSHPSVSLGTYPDSPSRAAICARSNQLESGSPTGEKALLLRILSDSFVVRGGQLVFLSAFPAEEEFLFPPLTFLKPDGQPQELRVDDATFTVVDVKPQR